MITAFAGSKAAEGFVNNVNWRWGVGCFAIIVPIVSMPLFITLKLSLRRAERKGIIVREKSTLPTLSGFLSGLKDFDREYQNLLTFR